MEQSQDKQKHVYLIDGSGYIFRAFFGLPPMSRSDGTPTNAVYGFCNMVFKLVEESGADYVGVLFDRARKTFRSDIYPEYKAHRPPAPDDLIPQFPLIRQATEAFNLPAIDMEGFEADDLIATYATIAAASGYKVTIVSSDKDLMQLVDSNITMYDPMKNIEIGADQVMEKFGVAPDLVIDVQALAGDSADNVPGVAGIGIKTAALLINQYGDLDNLLSKAHEIKQPKRRENLINQADMARISRKLVTLDRNMKLKIPLDDLLRKNIDHDKLLTFLKENEFRRLVSKFESEAAEIEMDGRTGPMPIEKVEYSLIQDIASLKKWVAAAKKKAIIAIDTETTSLDQMSAELVGISLAIETGAACYIPLAHKIKAEQGDLLGGLLDDNTTQTADIKQIPISEALAILKPMFEDKGILKIGQNIKYDMSILSQYGINIKSIDDTMLLSFVLSGGMHGHGMDELAKKHLDVDTIKFKDVCGAGKSQITFDYVGLDKELNYAAEDSHITLRLHKFIKPQLLSNKLTPVYETLERPLVDILANMEQRGILVDQVFLRKLSGEFAIRISELATNIYKLAEQEFNIASPKQLGEILFNHLGLKGGKKTKTGIFSTSASILEDLADAHPIINDILEWRSLSKLKSTYSDALVKQINPKTGRVHTSYMMTGAQTGRLSSTNPNLQNIPIRSEEGRKIRQAFIAKPDHKLISLDYSQIELRLVAEIADLKSMQQAFDDGIDIYAMSASEVFNIALEDMTADIRRKAKAINFGIIYGISAFGLAKQLGVSRTEAKEFIDNYFKRFPGIRAYMDEKIEYCRANGYVETLFNRRIHIGGILDKNPMRRNYAERQAINAPIQGSAADIIKRAMIRIPKALQDANLGNSVAMLLQVHDELIFEVPNELSQQAIDIIKPVMENAIKPAKLLKVPLIVDAGIGDNWHQAH